RRADALTDLVTLAAHAEATPGGAVPTIVVTLDFADLRADLAATALAGVDSGTALSPRTARRLACDAAIIPAVLAGPAQPLDVGRATRTIPTAIRRALVLRDGGCVFPGCQRP